MAIPEKISKLGLSENKDIGETLTASAQARLRALKDSASTKPEELKEYEVLLSDAIDSVDSSTDDHRKLLTEQTEYWKKHKKTATQ